MDVAVDMPDLVSGRGAHQFEGKLIQFGTARHPRLLSS